MHASSMENMQTCIDLAIRDRLDSRSLRVLDIGSQDVNGSYRSLFAEFDVEYVGVDLEDGRGVDLVLRDPYSLPFDDGSFDVVVSGQMLEHCEFFWRAFSDMRRVAGDGLIFLIAPSAGPIHRYPVDCYRFHPDAFQALARLEGLELLWVHHDERGPWRDLVGIFGPAGTELHDRPVRRRSPPAEQLDPHPDPVAEARGGRGSYLDFLSLAHERLQPRTYFEIGVRHGSSLARAPGAAIGVDPNPEVRNLSPGHLVVPATSDDFFAYDAALLESHEPVDLAFVDGLHLYENVLRDFMNIERHAHPSTVVVIDDVLPTHPVQAQRSRSSKVWTGDVWRTMDTFKKVRPDLRLILLDTDPCGSLLVLGLDPSNQELWHRYNSLVNRAVTEIQGPPSEVLRRTRAVAPDDEGIAPVLDVMARLRRSKARPSAVRASIDRVMADHDLSSL